MHTDLMYYKVRQSNIPAMVAFMAELLYGISEYIYYDSHGNLMIL